jgi:hypothetical protein
MAANTDSTSLRFKVAAMMLAPEVRLIPETAGTPFGRAKSADSALPILRQ